MYKFHVQIDKESDRATFIARNINEGGRPRLELPIEPMPGEDLHLAILRNAADFVEAMQESLQYDLKIVS